MSISPQHKIGNLVQAIMTNPTFSEDEKSQLVEDLINEIKKEYPDLQHHATKGDVRETELRLIKEIKELDIKAEKERKEIELKFTKEIEKVRNEIKELDVRAGKERKEIDIKAGKERKEIELKLTKEIEKVRNEIKDTKFTMLKWQFIFWATQFGAIVTIGFKLLGK